MDVCLINCYQVGAKSDTYKVQKNNAVRGFSHGQLLQKGDIMLSHIRNFVKNLGSHLASKADQEITDIDAWIGNLILDIHVALTVGSEFHAINKGPYSHSLVSTMHKTVTILQYCTQLLYLSLPIIRLFTLAWGGTSYAWSSAHVVSVLVIGFGALLAFVTYGMSHSPLFLYMVRIIDTLIRDICSSPATPPAHVTAETSRV